MSRRLSLVPIAGALAALLAVAGCSSSGPLDVRVSMPGVTPLAAGTVSTVIITPFRDRAPFAEFQPGPALEEELAKGLGRELKLKDKAGRVERAEGMAAAEPADAAAWRTAGASQGPGTVYLAGTIRMSSDVRKALDKKALADGPFNLVTKLLAKKRWRLEAEIYVISAATGETLHRETCDEFQDYGELDKPAEFAFSELSERVIQDLYRVLCATPTTETRTLLRQ